MFRAFLLFCKMANKSTIAITLQMITLLRVSTLSYHIQGARIHYLAKLHKGFKCSCWCVTIYKLIVIVLLLVVLQNKKDTVFSVCNGEASP